MKSTQEESTIQVQHMHRVIKQLVTVQLSDQEKDDIQLNVGDQDNPHTKDGDELTTGSESVGS